MSASVVVSLVGGLGNQLFQFAAAKGLQRDTDEPVVVDSRMSKEWPNRLPAVLHEGAFREATQRELLCLRQTPRVSIGQRTLISWREKVARQLPWLRLGGREFCEQNPVVFDPAILESRQPVLLRGYFQSEHYFAEVAEAVRGAFDPAPTEAGERLTEIRDRLSGDRPLVGVSLRTGYDYQHFELVLPHTYYEQAIDLVADQAGDASFVVFGDVAADCATFAESLQAHGPALSVADASPSCQLHLMGMLPHLVLSNSSFAWWGAWLGDSATNHDGPRVVVAPDPWWTLPDDIAPGRWLRLSHSGFEPRPHLSVRRVRPIVGDRILR